MLIYKVIKTFGHDRGYSCVFRQPNATHSNCSRLHGYALAFEITFIARELDENNWVIDFGSFKWLKNYLENMFDHKLLVAENDPFAKEICEFANKTGIATCVVIPNVGCEAFAKLVYDKIQEHLNKNSLYVRREVRVSAVKVSEHSGNSAIFEGYW